MKILTVLGARPQFIKAGSLSRAIQHFNKEHNKNIKEVIVHTGQHYDSNMSDIFFEEMKIPKPDYFLGIGGRSHGAMTGQMVEKIEEVVFKEQPDWMVVYGDTNSTLAGALVASKLHIKLAHIEAGLRSFNMKMPEEVNRILTDRVSDVLFCPTSNAVENLKKEGFPFIVASNKEQHILNVGDIMQDGALYYKNLSKQPILSVNIQEDNFILCTIHRAENTDDVMKLRNILEALNTISSEKKVILPLHPRTKKMIEQYKIETNNIHYIEPVGYLEMVWLISNAKCIITDSGGLQKEAYFFKKQCITLREETEWMELVEIGANVLVGSNKEKIIDEYNHIINLNKNIDTEDLYGTGTSSHKIIEFLLEN